MKETLSVSERFPHEFEVFRELADSLPQIVWIARADGTHDYYNRQWYEYTGLDLETSTRDAWSGLFHPDDRELAEKLWREALAAGTTYEIEFRLRRSSDGEYRWFLGRSLPRRSPDGQIVGWFGTCTDIHEQKKTEDALRCARDALRLESIQKDEFLGVVSHELRTPLNAVFGWTRLMQEHVLADDERAQAVDSIVRNSEAQARLIEDVLDITRILNHKLLLDREMLNIWSIVNHAVEAVLPAAENKGIAVVTGEESHELLVHGDRGRLQQVLINLLLNAIKFTPDGGEITVEVGEQGAFASVVVSDNGQGISPDLLPHIFEHFRQGDSSSARRHGGLGLGLAIAQQLVRLHGGRIEAASAGLDQGSRFTVLMPILALGSLPTGDDLRHPGEEGFPADHLRGLHIMVVDDEPSVRELLALTLAKCGASVTLAASVDHAMSLLPNLSPDVVVSDIAMPGADGYEFIQQLRGRVRSHGRDVPVIALTACASDQDRDLVRKAGFDGYLTKPVDPAALVRAIYQTHSETRVGFGSSVAVVC